MRNYHYSFKKIFSDFWFLFVFPTMVCWALYKIGFENFIYLELVIYFPLVFLSTFPLVTIFILLKTEISITGTEIVQKNFIKEKRIKWEDVISIEKKHFYRLHPDFEKPEDIEIIDNKKNVIRVYRFLEEFEEAEDYINRYSKNYIRG